MRRNETCLRGADKVNVTADRMPMVVVIVEVPGGDVEIVVHEDAPAGASVPVGHGVGSIAPPVAYVLTGVCVQWTERDTDAKVPAGQGFAVLASADST